MTNDEKNDENWYSKQSNIFKVLIALVGIVCIGTIVILAIGSLIPGLMLSEDGNEFKLYENEYLSFQYPKSFDDVTFLHLHEIDDEYVFYSLLKNSNKLDYIEVSSVDLDETLNPNYLEEYYYDLKENGSQLRDVKNFSVEKIDFNGVSAIKATVEYYDNKSGKYAIFLSLVHKGQLYYFYFRGNEINSIQSNYDLVKSTIIFK